MTQYVNHTKSDEVNNLNKKIEELTERNKYLEEKYTKLIKLEKLLDM